MALVLADRVQETTTTAGTGTLSLGGAVSGYRTFVSGIGSGNTTYYCIYDQTAQVWEIGLGTVTSGAPATLTRTTIYSNSSGTTSAITLAGNTAAVFAVYTASKNVSLDASGNVTPLGTIASGTWNGSTVGVAYGGTGVTTSSGASSVVLRDASQNVTANNFLFGYSAVTAAAGTTILTVSSAYYQRLSGSTTQTFQLPDATTLQNGHAFTFDNDSSGTLTVVDNASATVDTIPSGGYGFIFLESNATSAGSWGKYALLPGTYDFNTSAADFGGATLSNGVWNGTAVAPGYGGTGLTTFTAANYALYSSSASTLTAGTLPVAAGGTGSTTSTGSGAVVLATSPSLVTPALGTPSSGALTNCTSIPVNQATGTLPVANGGTGATSANAGLNNLMGYTTTATAAGTTTLTSSSTYKQYFTGTTTQTVVMPDVTTLALGRSYEIINNSTGTVTINSSGANLISTVPAGLSGVVTCISITGATAASWHWEYASFDSVTGTGACVFATSPTLVTPALGTPSSGTLTNCTGLPNAGLVNSSVTVNGTAISLGGSGTVTAANPNALTISSPLSGTSYTGAAAVTIALASGYGDTQNPYASKTANYILAAPTGVAGVPTFRAMVAADVPTLNQNTTGSAGSVANALTAGTGISYSSGTTYNGSAAITINNSGVTSAVAGTGIGVSGATGAVTITNNGVTSLVAGNGMSVSGSTGAVTITATGSTLNSQTAAYVAVAGDAGKMISITTGGVTINNSVFSAGNIVTIYNNSASSQTITQGVGVTLQWAGQSASTTGNRTLGLYGIATIVFISASSAVITGAGLT